MLKFVEPIGGLIMPEALVEVLDIVLFINLGELLSTDMDMLLGASFYESISLYLEVALATYPSLMNSSISLT
jgi:hypothetical protein